MAFRKSLRMLIVDDMETALGRMSVDGGFNFDYPGAVPNEFQMPTNANLFGGTVQCASCHDPHLTTNGAFLVTSNTDSALCTDCHLK